MTDVRVSEDLELQRKAAELLLQVIDTDWDDRNRKTVALLHALCELEWTSPASDGHEALEIARRLAAQGDTEASRDVVASQSDKGVAVRTLINRRFGRLEKELWPSRAGKGSVVEHRFMSSGLGVLPRPLKLVNVGSGNVNRFALKLEALPALRSESSRTALSPPPLDDSQEEHAARDRHHPPRLAPNPEPRATSSAWPDRPETLGPDGVEITYFEIETALPRWLQGVPIKPIRTRSFFWVVAFLLGFGLVAAEVMKIILAALAANTTLAVIKLLLFLAIVVPFSWLLVRPWAHLSEDCVTIAPLLWMFSAHQGNSVLELRRDPAGHASPQIHLVRYAADCPLCNQRQGRSAIGVEAGRLEFLGRRLVGRCRHAPNAHVFSFDHITRKGKLLR